MPLQTQIPQTQPLQTITKQMLWQLKALGEMPHFRFGCIQDLVDDKFRAGPSPRQLPSLQRSAAVFALRSFCAE